MHVTVSGAFISEVNDVINVMRVTDTSVDIQINNLSHDWITQSHVLSVIVTSNKDVILDEPLPTWSDVHKGRADHYAAINKMTISQSHRNDHSQLDTQVIC